MATISSTPDYIKITETELQTIKKEGENIVVLVDSEEIGSFLVSDLGEVGEFEEKIESQPNDEIWYTSTDGNIIEPNSATGFGANIISNTYTGGKGVIKFDGDVTSIGDEVFQNCSSLSSIIIPNSVTSIGIRAFSNCSSLSSITIPNSVISIGIQVFQYCTRLSSITIPDSVTSIGINAFYGCSSLSSITIPNSVTSVGNMAFHGCSSKLYITYEGTVEQFNSLNAKNWDNRNVIVHCSDGDVTVKSSK